MLCKVAVLQTTTTPVELDTAVSVPADKLLIPKFPIVAVVMTLAFVSYIPVAYIVPVVTTLPTVDVPVTVMLPPTVKSRPMPAPPTTRIAPVSVDVEFVLDVTVIVTTVNGLLLTTPLCSCQPTPFHNHVLVPML